MKCGRRAGMIAAALVVVLGTAFPALSQLTPDFMPKGGKTLLLDTFGKAPDASMLEAIVGEARDEAGWSALLEGKAKDLGSRELRTLAAYLAVNAPLQATAVDAAAKAGTIADVLPADGRELAWNGCQSCHSLFTSYLTQDRDLEGWHNMFRSPFHKELKMTERERDEFARYSAINMPMKFEDVPEDLRF